MDDPIIQEMFRLGRLSNETYNRIKDLQGELVDIDIQLHNLGPRLDDLQEYEDWWRAWWTDFDAWDAATPSEAPTWDAEAA